MFENDAYIQALKKAVKNFPDAVRNNIGQSTIREVAGLPTDVQQKIQEAFALREQNINQRINAAKKQMAEMPEDVNAAKVLKDAQKEKADLLMDRMVNRAGAVAGDYLGDGSRSLWWLINAAQAVAGLAGRRIMKDEGYGPLAQAIGATGLTLGMELASGNIDPTNLAEAGRPKGYSTLFPKEIERINPETGKTEIVLDRTKSNNPAAEIAARYFLNRTGRILPEEEFLKERPDVTPEEYARFREAKNKNTFFGIEDMPIQTSIPLGAIAGTTISAMGNRNKIAGALLGGIAAPLTKEIFVDVPTSLGILHGTTETPDDPLGEIEFLGYRIPFKAIAATALLGAGLKYGSRALKNKVNNGIVNPAQLEFDLDALKKGVVQYKQKPL